MPSVTLVGKQFNYEIVGNGEPVVHIHGLEPSWEGAGGNARKTGIPKLSNFLKDRFRYIGYSSYGADRVGFAAGTENGTDVDVIANDCFVLLQHLNLTRVHVFAHRLVGYPALKLALEHPDLIASVGLLDFAIIQPILLKPKLQAATARMMQRAAMNPQYQERMEMIRQMAEAAKSGTMPNGEPVDPEVAARINSIPKGFLEQFAPGADQNDPVLMQLKMWTSQMLSTPYEEVATRVKQPILSVIWADGEDWTVQSSELLKNWLLQTETFTVPKKSHWYSGENDEGLAAGLIDFYSRHPLS